MQCNISTTITIKLEPTQRGREFDVTTHSNLKTPVRRLRYLNWCGYRDSNPGPRPWQGRALTAELHPHALQRL